MPEYDEWLSIAKDFQKTQAASVMIFEHWINTVKLWQAIEKYWKIQNMIIWWASGRSQGFARRGGFFNKYDIAPIASQEETLVLNEEHEEELDDYLQAKGEKILNTYDILIYGSQGKNHFDRGEKGSEWVKVTDHMSYSVETGKASGQSLIFGTKPVQILIPYVKILCPRNGIIAEPFGGSGSTLIACEIMKRKCRVIELSPIYAEVILRRWEKFTGQKAEIIANISQNEPNPQNS